MNANSIKQYIFEKLFYPKVVIINEPGMIINYSSKKYGHFNKFKRNLLYFEEIISKIQIETIRRHGIDKNRTLWYKIGKDLGIRYILVGGGKPVSKIILPEIIEYILKNL